MSKPTKKSVTAWEHPNANINSQYGDITYRQWCDREIERMNGNGGNVFLCEQGGYIAICRG